MTNTTARKTARSFSLDGIETELLSTAQDFVLVVQAKTVAEPRGENFLSWATRNREFIADALNCHGGLLFRNFLLSPTEFKKFGDLVFPENIRHDYRGGMAPRNQVSEGLWESTRTPKQCQLPHHHELSLMPVEYAPSKIMFYCETPAESGGQTPVCSNRIFSKRLSPALFSKFQNLGVQYIRNLTRETNPGLATIGWVQSYRTEDRTSVEQFCEQFKISVQWKSDGGMRTKHHGQGTAVHPATGESLWFNHAFILNRSSGIPGVLSRAHLETLGRAYSPETLRLLASLAPDELPTNSLYGNGAYIEQDAIEEIAGVYSESQCTFDWQKGDFILLDNMLSTHARTPYTGEQRAIMVNWKYK